MNNYTFLDILINFFLVTFCAAITGVVIVLFLIIKKGIISQKQKVELPETQRTITKQETLNTLPEPEVEELLSKLEKEKRVITLGYNMMSSTHKEATKNKLLKIEEKIRQLNSIRACNQY